VPPATSWRERGVVGKKAVEAGFDVGEKVKANVHILYKQ